VEGLAEEAERIHVCFYSAPFGVVPVELSETYPLSQFEATEPLDGESLEHAAEQVGLYFEESEYTIAVLHAGMDSLDALVEVRCGEASKKIGKPLKVVSNPDPWEDEAIGRLISALQERRE